MQDWQEWRAKSKSEISVKARAISLADRIIDYASTNTTPATVGPMEIYNHLSYFFERAIEDTRQELLRNGARSNELDRQSHLTQMLSSPDIRSNIVFLGNEMKRVANQLAE